MKYPSIRIEGSILSADILSQIETGEKGGQSPKDFGLDPKIKVKDEIAQAWSDVQAYWGIFKHRRDRLEKDSTGTSETRKYWIIPFLDVLGYEVRHGGKAEVVNNKSYSISHRARNLDKFPIHIMGFNDSLDSKRSEGGPRMSPHALVQEYLNLTEHLYAIVTNGLRLRILRDSSRLIKLSYIEFDLEQMLEEGHFSDFAILYRLIHVSRMPQKMDAGPESLFEKYHQDALDSGSRIREGLSWAVEDSIIALSNGFLQHPANETLRTLIQEEKLTHEEFYLLQLRLIYRILFLMVIEERHLVYPKSSDRRLRDIYYNYYSISHLRTLCDKPYLTSEKHQDIWINLKHTFALFESEEKGKHLSIKPLAGDLFGPQSIGILSQSQLDNRTLLTCLRNLNTFENPTTKQLMRVNYASLNVEEFGSVYEGLLEYDPVIYQEHGQYTFNFKKGDKRSSSGSHYTPDELVQPLIRHSLDHIIADRLKFPNPEQALLSITVCDVACGSGHILLNAARRIGTELAKIRHKEDQPSPDHLRPAIRDAINHCIYGVDKNPLAVELCKVALWIEAHNPGEPLNFLDHHIKCGDSIVGIAHIEDLQKGIPNEAFKALPGDDKAVATEFRRLNTKQKKGDLALLNFTQTVKDPMHNLTELFQVFNTLPETTPQEIETKRQEYLTLTQDTHYQSLKTLADIQVAQFFLPKTQDTMQSLTPHATYHQFLSGHPFQSTHQAQSAKKISKNKSFFHWPLEFPEIFSQGGFDCILGNPPFLGNRKIKGTFGASYLEWLAYTFAPAGAIELVGYFFRRIFNLIKNKGFQSLIATNTIAQGACREGSLDVIKDQNGSINHAIKSTRWPGLAAVEVSLVSIFKGKWTQKFTLNNKKVERITPYLDDAEDLGNPYTLVQNQNKSFQGSIILGKGFILTPDQAQYLIEKNPKNKDVLFPYLNGDDLNSRPDQSPSRWVINFFDWPEEKCRLEYPDCFEILERLVKPERLSKAKDVREAPWWQFWRSRDELYRTIAPLERVLVVVLHSKTGAFSIINSKMIFSHALGIVTSDAYYHFCLLNSSFHFFWAWKMASTMGGSTLRYTPSDCYGNFPFPQNLSYEVSKNLDLNGINYNQIRKGIMVKTQLGLTKVYNQFHNKSLVEIHDDLIESEIEKKYGKETLVLWRHLRKTGETCSFNEAVMDIVRLRELHKEMDLAVLEAYGWSDIDLKHDFYEVDYLPENDRVRYTISPEARKEILKRLLLLNHEIHEQEVKAGLVKNNKEKSKKANPTQSNPSSNTPTQKSFAFATEPQEQTPANPQYLCPECNSPLEFHKSQYHDFYRCSKWEKGCRKSVVASQIETQGIRKK